MKREGPSQGVTSDVVSLTQEFDFLCRMKDNFPKPLENIDVVRRTKSTLNVLLGCRVEDSWNVVGDRDPS